MDEKKSEILPKYWVERRSKTNSNRKYFFNIKTGKSTWKLPEDVASMNQKQDSLRFKTKTAFTKKSNPAEERLNKLKLQLSIERRVSTSIKSKTEPLLPLAQANIKIKHSNLQNYKKRKNANLQNISAEKIKFDPDLNFQQNHDCHTESSPHLKKSKSNKKIIENNNNNVKTNNISAHERLQSLKKILSIKNKVYDTSMENVFGNYTSCEDSFEEMEWETIPQKEILTELNELRKNEKDSYVTVDGFSLINKSIFLSNQIPQYFYLIVDTNVFLSDLKYLYTLIQNDFAYLNYSFLVVPYMVLQELDKIKFRKNTKIASISSQSIAFINKELKQSNTKIRGQNAIDAQNYIIEIQNSDDKILNCCLQIKNSFNMVVLLSNDINLRNKAMCNEIESYSKSEFDQKKEDLKIRIRQKNY